MQPLSPDNQPDVKMRHQALVDQLKTRGEIVTPEVEAAFRAVPRHMFLPGIPLEDVYADKVIGTKSIEGRFVSSSSQPAIMAIMLEQLQLRPGQSVLEIGAGTGYNAALMAHIVGETGRVVTIDIDEDIVEGARAHLAAAGFARVQVIQADGATGYPQGAPYDRIILTVSANDILPAWYEQLCPAGVLLLPLAVRGPQVCVAFQRSDDHLESTSVRACGFMSLRGSFAPADDLVQLDPEPGVLFLRIGDTHAVDVEAILRHLESPGRTLALPLKVNRHEALWSISLWLSLHEPGFCNLIATGRAFERNLFPTLFNFSKNSAIAPGLLAEHALSLLTRASQEEADGLDHPLSLAIHSFGPDDTLAQHLANRLLAWEAAGRLSERQLHINAYPGGVTPNLPADTSRSVVVSKQYTQLVCNW